MEENCSSYKLILNTREFLIPSDFNTLRDIKDDIYQSLITTHQYEVKSYVDEQTFQSFIDYWIKGEIPEFFYDKRLCEYIQLSEEFDIMKNLIQLFMNNSSHTNIHPLMKNIDNRFQIRSKKADLEKLKNNFKQGIEIIFNNEAVGFNPKIYESNNILMYSLKTGISEDINSITKKKTDINGFSFILNENDKTAQLFSINKKDESEIFIPSTIKHESIEYKITSFAKYSFSDLCNLKSLKFDENLTIEKFDADIGCDNLEEVSIPDNVFEFSDAWCAQTVKLTKVKISPKNKNLIFYEDKYLIGKSDRKSDIFDILYFARRDIEKAIIPPFIRIISPFAFNFCKNLKKVEFSGDSNLQIISHDAFTHSSLRSIYIPKHVKKISYYAFNECPLVDLTFSEDSELEIIDDSSFRRTKLKSISIPANVKIIGNSAFYLCELFNKVEFSENSKLKIIGAESFGYTVLNNILIPRSVVAIGDSSFEGCSHLNKVVIQKDSQLLMIGEKAFQQSQIRSILIPRKVIVIGKESFSTCANMKHVDFEENSQLKNIDDNAFLNNNLDGISIPSSVVRIGECVFAYSNFFNNVQFQKDSELRIIDKLAFTSTQINKIYIPSHVVRICEKSFDCCKMLKCVEFDENSELEVIEESAFNETSIETLTIPSNVNQIQKNAFSKCKYFTKLDLSNDLQIKSIPFLFSHSSITCISIPDNLVEFGENWCISTPNLVEVKISQNNKNFKYYEDKYLIGKSDIKSETFDVLYFVRRDIEEAIVPSFIKFISSSAFNSCDNLNKVDFMEDSQLQIIGDSAFFDIKIKTIKIPQHVKEIGKSAFGYCDKLEKIEFSENSELKIIKENSFGYTALTKIVIPSSVVEIQTYAFANCFALTEVEFAKNSEIKCINNDVFIESPIKIFSFPENLVELKENWCVESSNLMEIKISPKNKNFVFYEDKYLLGKSDLKSDVFDILYFARRDIEEAIIPSFIRIISPCAFNCCRDLQKVEFSDDSQLQIIKQNAFSDTSLESIYIPQSVIEISGNIFENTPIMKIEFAPNSMLKTIGEYSFYDTRIESISIPSNVTKICANAFNYSDLSCVIFEENSKLELIDSFAFSNSAIVRISIPKSVIKIDESSFEYCENLKDLDLTECSNLVFIGYNAFNCTQIRSIFIPSSVTYIDKNAFISCNNLQIIEIGEESKLKLFNYTNIQSNGIIMVPSGLISILFNDI
ncbi:hypothetical protein M9Y10_037443 [Tritrichomonas musculus]|uniref:Uncharacterized protein n=1 Tax=Tritrichomonas musculus TaxID=1915356 RepID=A0ABR2GSJ8_9EUKA